jgi:hypothetical protein
MNLPNSCTICIPLEAIPLPSNCPVKPLPGHSIAPPATATHRLSLSEPGWLNFRERRRSFSDLRHRVLAPLQLFALMRSRPDILGEFSNNVGPFSPNLVLSARLFSANVVRKSGCFWARRFVLGPLPLPPKKAWASWPSPDAGLPRSSSAPPSASQEKNSPFPPSSFDGQLKTRQAPGTSSEPYLIPVLADPRKLIQALDSSHPAATGTADATTPDRRRAGAHIRRTNTR